MKYDSRLQDCCSAFLHFKLSLFMAIKLTYLMVMTVMVLLVYLLYSLDIMPPSFISPPYYLHEFAAEVYLSPGYAPLSLCDSDE